MKKKSRKSSDGPDIKSGDTDSICKKKKKDKQRGLKKQFKKRTQEKAVRKVCLAIERVNSKKGGSIKDTASRLGLSEEILKRWKSDWKNYRREVKARGRPSVRSPLTQRQAVIQSLKDLGPQTGMPTLQGMFKNMPKRELENILWRFREHDKLKNSPLLNVLTWKKPGTVWAMDHMKPPSAIAC